MVGKGVLCTVGVSITQKVMARLIPKPAYIHFHARFNDDSATTAKLCVLKKSSLKVCYVGCSSRDQKYGSGGCEQGGISNVSNVIWQPKGVGSKGLAL